jgi:NADH dehydrogenase
MELGIVTVFGGAGFIGGYVVRALARQGARVRVVCRRPEEAIRCKPMGDVAQVVPFCGNIRDDASVAAAVDGADAVVNLVGVLHGSGKQSFDALHHEGAARIARAVANAGVSRLIHVSAIGASPEAPSCYARSKGVGEKAVLDAFPAATILRPSVVFGPEDHFFNLLGAMTRLFMVMPLIGGGHTKFQPVHVCDVADAVTRVATDPALGGRVFELGGPKQYSYRELVEIVLGETRRKCLLVPMPFQIASIMGFFAEIAFYGNVVARPPVTRDQVRQLRSDNIVSDAAEGFAALGIEPMALDAILPTYLARFQRANARTGTPARTA